MYMYMSISHYVDYRSLDACVRACVRAWLVSYIHYIHGKEKPHLVHEGCVYVDPKDGGIGAQTCPD